MTQSHGNTGEKVLVAIDIAKQRNAVLVQLIVAEFSVVLTEIFEIFGAVSSCVGSKL